MISYGTFDFDFGVALMEYIMNKCVCEGGAVLLCLVVWTPLLRAPPPQQYLTRHKHIHNRCWLQHPRDRAYSRDKVNLFLPTAEELVADNRKDLLEKVGGKKQGRVAGQGDVCACLCVRSFRHHRHPSFRLHYAQIIKYGGFENVARRLQLGFKS